MPWRRHHRFWRHLVTDRGAARRRFPDAALDRIEAAIAAGERDASRTGPLRRSSPTLPLARVLAGVSPRERALEVFGQLRIWDTEENCGVLVYLLLADRDVEIVADRGIHARVGSDAWEAVCRAMEAAFRERRYRRKAPKPGSVRSTRCWRRTSRPPVRAGVATRSPTAR